MVRVPHPRDGRARLVRLTDSGRAFWLGLQDSITDFYRQALEDLSFDDGVSLLHLLKKLQQGLLQLSLDAERPTD